MEDRRDELDLLLVALAELLGAAVREVRDRGTVSSQCRAWAPGPVTRQAIERGEVDQLLEDRHPRVQATLLREVAPRATRQLGRRGAVPADLALVGVQDAQADAHRRGLARAVGAEEAEDPARAAR